MNLANDLAKPSGIEEAGQVEQRFEKSIGRDWNVQIGLGHIGGIKLQWGGKKESKSRSLPVVQKRTLASDFERILASSEEEPCILWDHSARKAWLVRKVSVLYLALLRKAERWRYVFGLKTNWDLGSGNLPERELHYMHHANAGNSRLGSGCAATSMLRENCRFRVCGADGQRCDYEKSVDELVRDISEGMEMGTDLCSGDSGRIQEKEHLLGYNFQDIMCDKRIMLLRKLRVDDKIRRWKTIAESEGTHVIFCNRLGPIWDCQCDLHVCPAGKWRLNPPKGSLTGSYEDFKTIYSTELMRAPEEPLSIYPFDSTVSADAVEADQADKYVLVCGKIAGLPEKLQDDATTLQEKAKKIKKRWATHGVQASNRLQASFEGRRALRPEHCYLLSI